MRKVIKMVNVTILSVSVSLHCYRRPNIYNSCHCCFFVPDRFVIVPISMQINLKVLIPP